MVVGIMLPGCATVDPSADFRRAGRLITERTGAAEVYDPVVDEQIRERVSALLDDGLTVQEAVQVALLNNREFQSLFHALGASRADVVQSRLLSNPTFALTARFPEAGGRSNFGFAIGQPLAELWQIPIRKKIAEAELEKTVLSVLQRAVALTGDVHRRYYELAALRAEIDIAAADLELADRSVKIADARFAAGEVSKLDVNLVRGRLLEVNRTLIELNRDREVAALALARLLGLSRESADWQPTDPLPDAGDAEDAIDWLQVGFELRADAQIADAEVAEAERQLRLELRKVFSEVEVGFEFEREERRPLPDRDVLADTVRESVAAGQLTAPEIEPRSQREKERRQEIDYSVGPMLELSLPIFDQNRAQIAKARFELERRRKLREDLLDAIAREVGEAVVAARASRALVQFYERESLPLADANLELARQLYQSGEQNIIVLIEAQQSLIDQRRQYLRARRDHAVALAELERATGGRRDGAKP